MDLDGSRRQFMSPENTANSHNAVSTKVLASLTIGRAVLWIP